MSRCGLKGRRGPARRDPAALRAAMRGSARSPGVSPRAGSRRPFRPKIPSEDQCQNPGRTPPPKIRDGQRIINKAHIAWRRASAERTQLRPREAGWLLPPNEPPQSSTTTLEDAFYRNEPNVRPREAGVVSCRRTNPIALSTTLGGADYVRTNPIADPREAGVGFFRRTRTR